MDEYIVEGGTLTEVYHNALVLLNETNNLIDCADWNTKQLECSMTLVVNEPLKEPRISKLFIGGPRELEQYCQEMVDGILDFEVDKGNWKYTYHKRMVDYPCVEGDNKLILNQIDFVINELKRNPSSRRAVIDIRDNGTDLGSNEPACLQHIQYFTRYNKLHCKVLFRSNDACKATFMNAFALIKLQEKIAKELNVEVGTYTHRANSFHCYEKDIPMLRGYCKRIINESLSDLTYEYENDWDELMSMYDKEISKEVEKLKNR